jgi:hypothetical protein
MGAHPNFRSPFLVGPIPAVLALNGTYADLL